MTADQDITRIVRSWLRADEHESADRILDAVLARLDTTPQRRPLWPSRRFAFMISYIRLAGAAGVVLVAAVVGYSLLPGHGTGGPPTSSPTVSQTNRPSVAAPSFVVPSDSTPTAIPLSSIDNAPLSIGTYTLSGFPAGITFTIPNAGWSVCSESEVEQSVCRDFAPGEPPVAIAFVLPVNVVADPCSAGHELLNPPIGPSIDDLAAAIANMPRFTVTTPVPFTIDGFEGKEFTVTAPKDTSCDLRTWATAQRPTGMGPGEVNLVRIFAINGTRVLISGASNPADSQPAERLAALREVFDSVHVRR